MESYKNGIKILANPRFEQPGPQVILPTNYENFFQKILKACNLIICYKTSIFRQPIQLFCCTDCIYLRLLFKTSSRKDLWHYLYQTSRGIHTELKTGVFIRGGKGPIRTRRQNHNCPWQNPRTNFVMKIFVSSVASALT